MLVPPSATTVSGSVWVAGIVRTRSAVAPAMKKVWVNAVFWYSGPVAGGPRASAEFQVPLTKFTSTWPGAKLPWSRKR
jgi:hypothetical protein